MKKVKVVSLLILSVVLVVVVVQNTASVQARFFWMTAEIPVIILLLLTSITGFILGLLVALFVKSGARLKSGR